MIRSLVYCSLFNNVCQRQRIVKAISSVGSIQCKLAVANNSTIINVMLTIYPSLASFMTKRVAVVLALGQSNLTYAMPPIWALLLTETSNNILMHGNPDNNATYKLQLAVALA